MTERTHGPKLRFLKKLSLSRQDVVERSSSSTSSSSSSLGSTSSGMSSSSAMRSVEQTATRDSSQDPSSSSTISSSRQRESSLIASMSRLFGLARRKSKENVSLPPSAKSQESDVDWKAGHRLGVSDLEGIKPEEDGDDQNLERRGHYTRLNLDSTTFKPEQGSDASSISTIIGSSSSISTPPLSTLREDETRGTETSMGSSVSIIGQQPSTSHSASISQSSSGLSSSLSSSSTSTGSSVFSSEGGKVSRFSGYMGIAPASSVYQGGDMPSISIMLSLCNKTWLLSETYQSLTPDVRHTQRKQINEMLDTCDWRGHDQEGNKQPISPEDREKLHERYVALRKLWIEKDPAPTDKGGLTKKLASVSEILARGYWDHTAIAPTKSKAVFLLDEKEKRMLDQIKGDIHIALGK